MRPGILARPGGRAQHRRAWTPGGIGPTADGKGANLIYGILTDVYKSDPAAGAGQNFSALLNDLTRDSPSLQPGSVSRLTVNGAEAETAHCIDRSANNGRGEHDCCSEQGEPPGEAD